MMLDRDTRLFLAIADQGSLAAAGRRTGLSAPMVSKRLAQLEARLGTPLFRRTTRRLELTAKGERYRTDMIAIDAAVEDAQARLIDRSLEPSGLLRIAAPTSFGRLHIAPGLPAFLDAHPRIELDLQLSDRLVDLLSDRIDLAIRIANEAPSGLVAHRLAANRRLLCAAPDYLAKHGAPASVAELSRHHLLAAEGQLPWRLARPGRVHLVEGQSRVITNSSEMVRELTLGGAGIALRSLWDVSRELAEGQLVRVLPGLEGSASAAIYAVRPKGAIVSAGVAAFETHLRAFMSPPPWEDARLPRSA